MSVETPVIVETNSSVDDPRPTCDPECGLLVRRGAEGVDVGYYCLELGYDLGAHAHIRHGLVLLCEGTLRLQLGRSRVEAHPGQALVLPAETEHLERPVDGRVRCLLIEIPAESEFDGAVSAFGDGPRTVPRIEQQLAERLAARMSDRSDLGRKALAADAYEAMLMVQQDRDEKTLSDAAPAWLGRVIERLRAPGIERPGLGELAREARVTPEHLARTFRRFTGMTVGGYLRCLRLLDAARALRESESPLAAVARSTGFSDQSHMTRQMRAYLGVTPGQYRKSWRGS